MGTSNYNLPLIDGTASARIPRDFNALAHDIDETLKNETDVIGRHLVDIDFSIVDLLNQVNTSRTESIAANRIYGLGVSHLDKNNGKIDETFLSSSLLAQIAGTASVGAQVPGRSLTSSAFNFKSVTPELLSFVKQSKNLFDKSTVQNGFAISLADGSLVATTNFTASDYIPVTPNTSYIRSSAYNTAFYDKDRQFISSTGSGRQFTTPANTAFVRVSFGSTLIDTYQFELGTVETSYVPYKLYTDEAAKLTFTTEFIKSNFESIPAEKTEIVSPGKNLFDKSKVSTGFYVNYLNGTLVANATYWASDYIPVVANAAYSMNFDGQLAFYNASKQYVSGVAGGGVVGNKTVTAPANAVYARFSTKDKDVFQVEKNVSPTPFEPFGYYVKSSLLPSGGVYESAKNMIAFLPSEICVAVGRTIELYNCQVAWAGNILNYHFKWDCQVGKSLKRKFSITGVTIGNYPLTLTIYDGNMQQVTSVTSTVKVVSNALSTTKTVLTIGDSLTNTTSTPKPWMSEIRTLSNNKINFVGTRGTASNEKHEGRSGFTSGNYLTATSYSFEGEGVHPFWNPSTSQFDFSYYKTNTGINPDAVNIWLGTNGIALDPTTNANNIKTIVDKIRSSDSAIPIYVTFTLYRGNQNGLGVQTSNDGYATNRGAWKLEEDRKVYNLMTRLYDLLKPYTNLYFIPVALQHDSEYNFGAVSTPVNPRATQTELLPVEATHPQTQGYLQIADIMFSVFAAHLT